MSDQEKNQQPEILNSLPDELKQEAKDLPPDILAAVLEVSIKRTWSGPLPPPEVFNKYPLAVQKTIVTQAKMQMEHRHKIEDKVVDSNITNSKKGMNYAFWITTLLIAAGVFLIMHGDSTAGLVAIFSPTAFVGGNFLIQKWREMRKIGKDASDDSDSEIKTTDE